MEQKSAPSDTFEINETGILSQNPYIGLFKVKTMLSRADRFAADEQRRRILGIDSGNALGGLQGEAMMLGQLHVRILEGPDWWVTSRHGLEIPDENIIGVLFSECIKKENERVEGIKKKAEESLAKMKAEDVKAK